MPVEGLAWSTVLARMGVALLAGCAIGWDRRRAGKPAGMRTHMLVSLGSCVLVLVPLGMGGGVEALSRTIQGIATGIGFLGAGEILHYFGRDEHKASIKGLTSAAAIWFTAALGIAAGAGLWKIVLLAVTAALLVLTMIKTVERWLVPRAGESKDKASKSGGDVEEED